jgi:enoyl-CoA hydratase/carnithine racemase
MISCDKNDGVWTLTIDRPDKANSLTAEMLSELADLAEGAISSGARVLILTGQGKVFCGGADLDAARAGLAQSPDWERLSTAIAAFPGLGIAALNGTVAGGAMGMILACDLRIATPGAQFFYPVMKLGFLPQPSDPARLVALVGPSRAKMILMAGLKIDADTALRWGLLDRITEPQSIIEDALALAEDTRATTSEHASAIKALIG